MCLVVQATGDKSVAFGNFAVRQRCASCSNEKTAHVSSVPVTGHGIHGRCGIAVPTLDDRGVHGSLTVAAFACGDSNRILAARTNVGVEPSARREDGQRRVNARRVPVGLGASAHADWSFAGLRNRCPRGISLDSRCFAARRLPREGSVEELKRLRRARGSDVRRPCSCFRLLAESDR